jgi:hypothetical protein
MPITFLPEYEHFPFMKKVSFSYRKIRWTYIPEGIEAEDPYINEYGKHPLKDAEAAILMAGAAIYAAKKMAVGDAIKAGAEGTIAALLEFLEVPWYIGKSYDALQTAKKLHEIDENVTHGSRKTIEKYDHQVKDIKDFVYRRK